MTPESFAILSALAWAIDSLLIRLGASHSSIVSAVFLSYCVAAVSFWTYVCVNYPLSFLWSPATVFFFLSGCFQPLLARMLFYTGLIRLGVSRAGPLLGTVPLFALFLAVALLGERPTLWVYAGTLLTVLSVWLLSSRAGGDSDWRVQDAVFPLGAAFFAAVGQNLRKAGLLIIPDPAVAGAVGISTSLVFFAMFLGLQGKASLIKIHTRSVPFFVPAAFVSTTAQLFSFVALTRGEISAVVPLLNVMPLFTLLLSGLFLRQTEKITGRIVVGTFLMVGGALIIIGR